MPCRFDRHHLEILVERRRAKTSARVPIGLNVDHDLLATAGDLGITLLALSVAAAVATLVHSHRRILLVNVLFDLQVQSMKIPKKCKKNKEGPAIRLVGPSNVLMMLASER